jgi:hypothetical protein
MTANSQIEAKLIRLQEYLRDWAMCGLHWSFERGLPRQVNSLVDNMQSAPSESGESRPGRYRFAMIVIDTCINDLCKRIPEASAVLLTRYLNRAGPAVFRHGRLSFLMLEEVNQIADRAELELIPMVERKNLLL